MSRRALYFFNCLQHLHYFVNTNGYPVNDIAIVRLKQPVDYSSHIRPIQIPDSYPSGTCYYAGWGPTQSKQFYIHSGIYSVILSVYPDLLISEDICEDVTSEPGKYPL